MKKDDYKRALDNIRCSDEFREKMEKQLSASESLTPEGYEDSVSSLEIAPKRYWLKSVAAAAAAVLLIGGAGTGAYRYLSNMDDEMPPDIVATEPERETFSTPFGEVSRMSLTIDGENGFSLSDIPETMVRDLAEVLNDNEFVHLEQEKGEGTYEEVAPLIVDCYGDSQFALWVYPNGIEFYEVGTNNKEPHWFSCEDIYMKIQGAVAKNIIFAELGSENDVVYDTDETVDMQTLSDDKKKEIHWIFEKYADMISVDYTSDGYPLLSSSIIEPSEIEGMGYDSLVFGNYASMLIDNRFIIKINNDDSFEVFHVSLGGVGYVYVFMAPHELCAEIHDCLIESDIVEETAEESTMESIDTGIKEYTPEAFAKSVYEQIHAMNDDVEVRFEPSKEIIARRIDFPLVGDSRNIILDIIKDMEWEKAEDYEPVIPFYDSYHLNREIEFGIDGYVYDQMSGLVCRTKDMEAYMKIIDVFETSLKSDNFTLAMYMLTSPEEEYDNLTAEYESYFHDENEDINRPSPRGKGHIHLSNSLDAENITLDEFDNDSLFAGCKIDYARRNDMTVVEVSGARNEVLGGNYMFFNLNTIADAVFFELNTVNVHEKSGTMTVVDGVSHFEFRIDYNGDFGCDITLDVDSRGTPLFFEKKPFGTDVEEAFYERFRISNVVYDSDSFTMPELSAKQSENIKKYDPFNE